MPDPHEEPAAPKLPKLSPGKLTAAQRDADIWAEQQIAERLPQVRQLAQSWGATVTAITALFGTGTVIDADDAVRSLSPSGWAIAYGVLAAAALVLAAGSILYAARASEAQLTAIPPGVDERLALRDKLFDDAVNSLRTSRVVALVAVVFLILSFAVRWYGPREEEPASASEARLAEAVAVAEGFELAPERGAVGSVLPF